MTQRLYVLDFDRTLGDTNGFSKALLDAYDQVLPGAARDLERQMELAESTGVSFVTLDAARDLLGKADFARVLKLFMEQASGDRFLLPGARRLLDFIKKNDYDARIVSYGDTEWQELKLRACGLAKELDYEIITSPQKTEVVLGWKRSDGLFQIPGTMVAYDEVIIVDDKARAFSHWGSGLVGYWIQDGSELLPSQQGNVPEAVVVVDSLDEIVKREEVRIH